MPARAHARLAVLALLALVPALPSCNIVGPAFLLVHGPEKIKKLHTLDPRRPTVIFVDENNRIKPPPAAAAPAPEPPVDEATETPEAEPGRETLRRKKKR